MKNKFHQLQSAPTVRRRKLLNLLLASPSLVIACCFRKRNEPSPMAPVAKWVKPKDVWVPEDYYVFLKSLPPAARMILMKTSECIDEKAVEAEHNQSAEADARAIQKQTLWITSNIVEYPFKDEKVMDYHKAVKWAAEQSGIDVEQLAGKSTFHIERKLMEKSFAGLWDKLTPDQRMKLLEDLDKNGELKDKAATAALSGSAALGALSATVAFSGFAFYTSMSATIAAVAGAVNVVIPFVGYTSASTAVGALSGPVGWGIMAVAAIGGVVLSGRANLQKTVCLLCQVHSLKIEALMAAGFSYEDLS